MKVFWYIYIFTDILRFDHIFVQFLNIYILGAFLKCKLTLLVTLTATSTLKPMKPYPYHGNPDLSMVGVFKGQVRVAPETPGLPCHHSHRPR